MASKIYIYVYAKKTLDRYAAWQIRLSVQYWIFDARIQVYICDTRMRALQSLSSAVIYIKKYDSLHGHSREFRSSCTCTTNNKQWSAAEIACPMCSTPRQLLPSLMQKDRQLSIWHVVWWFPCTTGFLLRDFFFAFFYVVSIEVERTSILIFYCKPWFYLFKKNNI